MNLEAFCGEFEKFKHPFTGGNYIYVTDGRIGIRASILNSTKIFSPNLEYTQKIDEMLELCTKDRPIDFVFKKESAEYSPCKECKGTGIIKECAECSGTGVIECCECRQDRDCPDCDGNGKAESEKCEMCNGIGKVLKEQFTDITVDLRVSSKFLCTICENLEGVKFYETDKYIYFTFENGEGILMPVRK